MDEKVTAAVKRKTEAYTKYRQSSQLQKSRQQGEGRGAKGSPYLREEDSNGSEEEPQSVLQLREVEDEDEDRSQRPGISRRTHELLNVFPTPMFEQRAYREPLTDITINDDMVAAVLRRLKPNKSPGGDGLHPRVLVELKNEMATPLRMIFTRSLQEGQLTPVMERS